MNHDHDYDDGRVEQKEIQEEFISVNKRGNNGCEEEREKI